MIVLDAVAPYVAKIFDALRADKFPLHSAKVFIIMAEMMKLLWQTTIVQPSISG